MFNISALLNRNGKDKLGDEVYGKGFVSFAPSQLTSDTPGAAVASPSSPGEPSAWQLIPSSICLEGILVAPSEKQALEIAGDCFDAALLSEICHAKARVQALDELREHKSAETAQIHSDLKSTPAMVGREGVVLKDPLIPSGWDGILTIGILGLLLIALVGGVMNASSFAVPTCQSWLVAVVWVLPLFVLSLAWSLASDTNTQGTRFTDTLPSGLTAVALIGLAATFAARFAVERGILEQPSPLAQVLPGFQFFLQLIAEAVAVRLLFCALAGVRQRARLSGPDLVPNLEQAKLKARLDSVSAEMVAMASEQAKLRAFVEQAAAARRAFVSEARVRWFMIQRARNPRLQA